MRNRTTLATAALLAAAGLLTACGGSGGDAKPTAPATTATRPPTHTTTPPSTPPTTPPTTPPPTTMPPTTAAAKAKAKPKPTDCMPARDIYVWMKVPGVPAMAQALGDYSNCGRPSTFATVRGTSPTTEGTCTEAAWASDNPGYNTDAEPARRLKHVQVSVGPAC